MPNEDHVTIATEAVTILYVRNLNLYVCQNTFDLDIKNPKKAKFSNLFHKKLIENAMFITILKIAYFLNRDSKVMTILVVSPSSIFGARSGAIHFRCYFSLKLSH